MLPVRHRQISGINALCCWRLSRIEALTVALGSHFMPKLFSDPDARQRALARSRTG
jgi:hypothetical protein